MTASADRIAAILLALLGGFVVFEARRLPYWTANAPGPGFLPLWLGVLLAVASAVLFARTRTAPRMRQKGGAPPDRTAGMRLAAVVAFTAGTAALATAIGLVLASAVFMGVTLTLLRPGHTRANAAAVALTPILVWLLFVRWLGVPLPAGPFGF